MLTIGFVVSLDQTDYISEALEAIYRSTVVIKKQAIVVIVDNNSNGRVTNRLHQFKQRFPDITTIITNRSNKGYAYACNQVLDITNTPFICFPHSDTIVSATAFEHLVSVFVEPTIGIAMPTTCYADENVACVALLKKQFTKLKPNNKTFFGADSIKSLFKQLYSGSLDTYAKQITAVHRAQPISYVSEISSFCLAFRTELLKTVGGFNITFPLRGFEDKELYDRLRNKTRIVVCRTAYVHHHGNMTTDGTGLAYPQVRSRCEEIYSKIKQNLTKIATKTTNRLPIAQPVPVIAKPATVEQEVTDNFVNPLSFAPPVVSSKTSRIFHVANLSLFTHSPRLRAAQNLFLNSINTALTPNVSLIAAVREECEFPKFDTIQLKRDAITQLGDKKNLPFLKDLLDLAASKAHDNDWLVFTNSDCVLSPLFYKTLERYDAQPYVEYLRLDVQNNPVILKHVYTFPNKLFDIGIDGIAIRKSYYIETRSLIPDFVIGQPHWDTYISVLYRSLLPASQNGCDLYHPIHQQAWDFEKLSVSGQYNVDLFKRAVNDSRIPRDKFVECVVVEPDTAIIIAWFGRDPARIKATIEAISNSYDSQTLSAQYVFVELITDGQETSFPEFRNHPRLKHLIIKGSVTNEGLFQKEALFNIGAQHAIEYDYYIFLDSDVYCTQSNWLADIRAKLRLNQDAIVQGFEVCIDSLDPKYAFASWSYGFKNNCNSRLPFNPGICWGMTKSKFFELKGFNPFAIFGCGDGLFAVELGGDRAAEDFPYVYTVKQFHNVVRKLGVYAVIDYTHHHLTHVHHGNASERKYLQYQTASMFFSKPLLELVKLDHNGLLCWTEECNEQQLMKFFSQINALTDFHTIHDKIASVSTDTAVIIATYGRERAALVKQCVAQYKLQNLKVQIVIVELLFEEGALVDQTESSFDYNDPLIVVHTLRGGEANKQLCQKEAMYNIGAKLVAPTVQYLIFLDGDVYSLQKDWFARIRHKMIENKDHVVQGFDSVIDTIDPQYQFRSLVSNKQKRAQFSKTNPGICWALTKEKFIKFGGFNPFFVEYSGDSGFATEIFNTQTLLYEHYVLEFPCFVEIVRDVAAKGIPTHTEDELIHLHHGYFRDRSYNARKYIVSRWNKRIDQLVELDKNQLIAWRDLQCVERKSLQNIPADDDFNEVDEFYALQGYECRLHSQRKLTGQQKLTPDDHLSVSGMTQDGTINLLAFTVDQIGDHLEIEQSWCDNLVTIGTVSGSSVRLPISQSEIENKMGAVELTPRDRTKSGLCLFPLKRSWAGATIINSSAKKLVFDIKIEGSANFELATYFESKVDDTTCRSKIVQLPAKNFSYWDRLTLPLNEFVTSEFNFSDTRICLFSLTAPENTTVYLANIRIEKIDD